MMGGYHGGLIERTARTAGRWTARHVLEAGRPVRMVRIAGRRERIVLRIEHRMQQMVRIRTVTVMHAHRIGQSAGAAGPAGTAAGTAAAAGWSAHAERNGQRHLRMPHDGRRGGRSEVRAGMLRLTRTG